MGFSLSGSHVIFFIASLIVAGTVSGIFIGITMDISSSLSDRGERVREQLDTDFKIINDPVNIPSSGDYYIFYIKNIGGARLETTNESFQVFIDGVLIPKAYYYMTNDSINVAEVTEIRVRKSYISAGEHIIKIVGPLAIYDEFSFTI
ncbi:MAG: flagellar protein G [Candidatus Thermoplasmatota archaeon]